ncbi:unnamed protein product [Closterium sp. Naga37s-1]|nr:unnamed protein product [Closterium sp. Naga37s-1]
MALLAPAAVVFETAVTVPRVARTVVPASRVASRGVFLLPVRSRGAFARRSSSITRAAAQQPETQQAESAASPAVEDGNSSDVDVSKEISKAVKKTATTFAPRASTKSKNPAVPGSTLYTIFEAQAYLSAAFGGLLSYNLLFPSDEPDIWRLMGMWSIWMFTIPSLRARDCSENEKTALNYLFLVVPLVNVTLPLVWKSFAAVWTADVIVFTLFYAWKLEWFSKKESDSDS